MAKPIVLRLECCEIPIDRYFGKIASSDIGTKDDAAEFLEELLHEVLYYT